MHDITIVLLHRNMNEGRLRVESSSYKLQVDLVLWFGFQIDIVVVR